MLNLNILSLFLYFYLVVFDKRDEHVLLRP